MEGKTKKIRAASFSALIRREGINPYVDPPAGTGKALGRPGVVPVKVRLDGRVFRANLMPLGPQRTRAASGTRHRLYLHGIMRKAVGKDVGDRVKVVLTLDRTPRTEPVPPALGRALQRNARAERTFEALRPSRRKELLRYLNHLKTSEAFERVLAEVLSFLRNPRTKPGKNRHVIVRSVFR